MTEFVLDPHSWMLLAFVGLLAGFIDAVVGGGGMLTVPTLLSVGLPPHLTLGTNKLSASFASGTAAFTYFRKKLFDPAFWKHCFYSTLIGALGGTIVVNYISTDLLNKFLPVVILIAAIYTLLSRVKEIDNATLPEKNSKHKLTQRIQGFILGFYDGVSGPGTGAFWVISNMHLYRLNILLSSGIAKAMNFTSNFVSLLTFIYFGQVDWFIGLTMGACLMLGAFVGAHSAIYFGAKFIRPLFIIIVLIMAVNLGYNAWFSPSI